MSPGFTNLYSISSLIPLITIGIFIVAVIICFDCIWRVGHRIDVFLRLIVMALLVSIAKIGLGLIGLSSSPQWPLVLVLADLLQGLFFMGAMLMMYKIIRSLNLEKPKK